MPHYFRYLSLIILIVLCEVFKGCNTEGGAGQLRNTVSRALKDSVQNRAAMYLLDRLSYHSSHKTAQAQVYDTVIARYHHDVRMLERKIDSLQKLKFAPARPVADSEIDAGFLVHHVAEATVNYNNCSWKGEIDFNTFCEYVLPYRIGNEPVGDWRTYFKDHFAPYKDSIAGQRRMEDAAAIINALLYQERKGFRLRRQYALPDLSPVTSSLLQMGTCHELSFVGVAAMRSFGIPAAIDFTPQYGNRSGGHEWCSIPLSDTTCIPFDVGSAALNVYMSDDYVPSKVYRKNYSLNKESHYYHRGACSYLPAHFNDPFITDVTDQYKATATVDLPVFKTDAEYAYLCVFNNADWVPVGWGSVKNGKARFDKVVKGVVYLPVSIDSENFIHLNYPFMVDSLNNTVVFEPGPTVREVKLTRKYMLSNRVRYFVGRMVGGRFEASNTPLFTTKTLLHAITAYPGESYNTVLPEKNHRARYARYFSPPDSWGNIAELEFYDTSDGLVPLKGKIIGTDNVWQNDKQYAKERVFDGDALTLFNSNQADGSWVGMDFGKPVNLTKLRFLARTDGNSIYRDQLYELCYWGAHKGWISLGKQKAEDSYLVYKDVPDNALLLLHNLTMGNEERIFIYQNEEQIWF